MTESSANLTNGWDDDELTEWTDDQFRRAAVYDGQKLIRPADGTLTRPGRPKSIDPKRQVTLRIDGIVLDTFRATGKGWQSRINAELRKALGI